MAPDHECQLRAPAQFATTRWTIVLSAARSSTPESAAALETLCRTYWYPLYAYARRRGHSAEDACDATQEFFARLLEKRFLHDADQAKGKFRSFLLASLRHFLANEWDKAQAQKRGGGQALISIDAATAEGSYRLEPAHQLTAEKIFERRWALTLLEQVLRHLRADYATAGKERLFDALKPALVDPGRAAGYREIAKELGMSEGAVKVAVHRLRKSYRERLVEEISHTVATPAEIDEELQALMAAVAT
jgi:RNA polymerase sigma-70 factor (ECF subfamily)